MSEASVNQLLTEFRAFRDTQFENFRRDIVTWQQVTIKEVAETKSLAEATASSHDELKEKVETLKERQWFWSGIGTAAGTLLGWVVALATHFYPGHK